MMEEVEVEVEIEVEEAEEAVEVEVEIEVEIEVAFVAVAVEEVGEAVTVQETCFSSRRRLLASLPPSLTACLQAGRRYCASLSGGDESRKRPR